jgi:hypothetical protein
MARQYTPRAENARQATPSPVDKPNVEGVPIEPGHTTEPVETTIGTNSGVEVFNDGADSDDDISAPATGSEKADTAPVKKRPTRAQTLRDEAEQIQREQDAATLLGAPTFEVAYPAGYSRYLPGEDEIEVTLSGGSKVWVDVIGDHAHIPYGGRLKARSVEELATFTRLAGQSFLRLAPPD